MNCNIHKPFLFNCYKHHLGFLKHRISKVKSKEDFDILLKELLTLGSSVMDIYTGKLSPSAITKDIEQFLKSEKKFSPEDFNLWLHEYADYRVIRIADGSKWVLSKGEDNKRYIHFHPARYSPDTFRTNSSTLRTGVAAIAYSNMNDSCPINILLINEVRKVHLQLSPLRALNADCSIAEVIGRLEKV